MWLSWHLRNELQYIVNMWSSFGGGNISISESYSEGFSELNFEFHFNRLKCIPLLKGSKSQMSGLCIFIKPRNRYCVYVCVCVCVCVCCVCVCVCACMYVCECVCVCVQCMCVYYVCVCTVCVCMCVQRVCVQYVCVCICVCVCVCVCVRECVYYPADLASSLRMPVSCLSEHWGPSSCRLKRCPPQCLCALGDFLPQTATPFPHCPEQFSSPHHQSAVLPKRLLLRETRARSTG
ncbi:hypothetical protein COCON_G00001650 [Conger conger]|uniref:Uncharacterized protein n=1 Tax=Conger conger TaxID=82655 RepID=A0A9Q1I863_CONCO|nr:hypothetical protein COCON_G00001650 [Conger conger]